MVPLRPSVPSSLPASIENSTVYCSLTSASANFSCDYDSAQSFNSEVALALLRLTMPSCFAPLPFSRVSSSADTAKRAYYANSTHFSFHYQLIWSKTKYSFWSLLAFWAGSHTPPRLPSPWTCAPWVPSSMSDSPPPAHYAAPQSSRAGPFASATPWPFASTELSYSPFPSPFPSKFPIAKSVTFLHYSSAFSSPHTSPSPP